MSKTLNVTSKDFSTSHPKKKKNKKKQNQLYNTLNQPFTVPPLDMTLSVLNVTSTALHFCPGCDVENLRHEVECFEHDI